MQGIRHLGEDESNPSHESCVDGEGVLARAKTAYPQLLDALLLLHVLQQDFSLSDGGAELALQRYNVASERARLCHLRHAVADLPPRLHSPDCIRRHWLRYHAF